MRTIILYGIIAALAICLIPTRVQARQVQQEYILLIEDDGGQTVKLKTKEGIVEQNMNEYLACVLLSEMPFEFAQEARKAQCVAARTFAYKKMRSGKHDDCDLCADFACCQAWHDVSELREEYGEDFDTVWKQTMQIVKDTKDEVLTYHGQLIDATYFSCAAGSTEAAAAVWGSDVPYLQPVKSYGEETAAKYSSEASFTSEEFRSILSALRETLSLPLNPEKWVGKTTYTAGGGVDTMQIGNEAFRGTELRKAFRLNSTQFTVSFENGTFTFSVRGYGHRVGMSQYGADHMAKQGYAYTVILPYYYSGVQIKKLSQLSL